MSRYRCTWFYNQAQTGWSETWWTPDGISVTDLATKIRALTDARARMLTKAHILLAVRVSIEGVRRQTRLFIPPGFSFAQGSLVLPLRGDGVYDATSATRKSDQVRAAIQMEMRRQNEQISLRYLVGFPDIVSTTEPGALDRTVAQTWWDDLDNYYTVLFRDGWQIKRRSPVTVDPEHVVESWRLQAAAPGYIGFVLPGAVATGFVVGGKVHVRNTRMRSPGLRSLNGEWYIDAIDSTLVPGKNVHWLRNSAGYDPADMTHPGTVQRVAYEYVAPDGYSPRRVGVHKRGRPFGLLRGRVTQKRYVNA